MSLEAHLGKIREKGTYDSEGVFTLDREKALEKLAGFSLESKLHILLSLAGWLTKDGTSCVEFETEPKKLKIRRAATQLTPVQLEHLEDYLLTTAASHGLSLLALSQHIWSKHGKMSLELGETKRVWEKGQARQEPGNLEQGVELELHNKQLTGDPNPTAEFLAQYLVWAPFPWRLNGQPAQLLEVTGWLTLNEPPIAAAVVPDLALASVEVDFHLLCRWDPEGSTEVVLDGVTYSLSPPLYQGMRCVIFDQTVQRTVTQTEIVVSEAQRQAWSDAVTFVVQEFFRRVEFWNQNHFLKTHQAQIVEFVWPYLQQKIYSRVARALTSYLRRGLARACLNARLQLKDGEYAAAFDTLGWICTEKIGERERRFSSELESEFLQAIVLDSLSTEDLQEIYREFPSCAHVAKFFPKLISQLCLVFARNHRGLGETALAEARYLDSYFLPRLRENTWPISSHHVSHLDFESWSYPSWSNDIEHHSTDYLEGLFEILSWAQERQSPQKQMLKLLRERHYDFPTKWHQDYTLMRFESWRLQRRQAQTEWFKWLLMSRRRGWKPTFPPLSHDQQYQEIPSYELKDGAQAKLARLKCQTVYLEYAAMALQVAQQFKKSDEVKRFQGLLQSMERQVDLFTHEDDELDALIELARINIDLQRTELAEVLLRKAVSKIPAGDTARLPLLVDLAILQPQGVSSVLKGISKVMNISENVIGISLEMRAQNCMSPVPPHLPSRLRRLAWQLTGSQEMKAYRMAQVLFRKSIGPVWHESSEQNWVLDAISLLKEK